MNTSKQILLGQRRSLPHQDFIQRPILSIHEEHALKQTILRSVLEQLCVAQQAKKQ